MKADVVVEPWTTVTVPPLVPAGTVTAVTVPPVKPGGWYELGREGRESLVFLFRLARVGRMGPMGLAFTGYQLWRRLSPQQKAAIRSRAGVLVRRARDRRRDAGAADAGAARSVSSRVGAATAPQEENPVTSDRSSVD